MSQLSKTFNTNPEGYNKYRPSYPLSTRDAIIDQTKIRKNARILEIGCGTGQATGYFQELEPEQVCLDPGLDLLESCKVHFPAYRYVCSTYENFDSAESSFDLIYAATSFHWVSKGTRFTKSADLLKLGGHLAVLTDRHVKNMTGFFKDVDEVYRLIAPDMLSTFTTNSEEELEKSPLALVLESETDRNIVYSADEYIGLLKTFSGHIALGQDRLNQLCDKIHTMIENHYDGKIEKTLTTYLSIYQNA